jgi:predicted esterase
MSAPKPIVIPAQGKHTATLIVTHGLGDSGVGWVFLAEQWLMKNKMEQVKFVFPNAPSIPITINGGMRMPGWYDIVSSPSREGQSKTMVLTKIQTSFETINRTEDEAGILRSQQYLHGLIAEEVASGIPSERIVLGGFSQGGAMSLMAGLTCPQKLGGIVGLSCYLLLQSKIKNLIDHGDNVNKDTKIFMGHGDSDPVVKPQFGKMTADQLKEWGFDVDFKTYRSVSRSVVLDELTLCRNLAHSAAPQEIDDLEAFLNATIPPTKDAPSNQGSL